MIEEVMFNSSQIHIVPSPKSLRISGHGVKLGAIEVTGSLALAELIQEGLPENLIGNMEVAGLSIRLEESRPDSSVPDAYKDQSYALQVLDTGAVIKAGTATGRFYGIQTLAQLIWSCSSAGEIPGLEIIDWPSLTDRGAHICYHVVREFLPLMAPNFEELCRRIKILGHYKCNLLLLELEALLPHTKHPILSCKLAFSKEQLRLIADLCKENHIEILPIIQCLGHVYYVLSHPEYAHLREVVDTTQQYCPTNPEVLDFYMELVDDVLEMFPDVRRLHIGGDECRRLGVCDRCKDKAGRVGEMKVYSDHVAEVCRRVLDRGLIPYLWADIIQDNPEVAKEFPEGTTAVYWNYDLLDWHSKHVLDSLIDTGMDVITASGAKWGSHTHTMFYYSRAMRGMSALARETRRAGLYGIIVTDWMKAVPHELSIPALAYGVSEAWGENRSQREFEAAFGLLYFGLPYSIADGVGNACRLIEGLSPLCEDSQNLQVDPLDRYDQSSNTIREQIAKLVQQRAKPETLPKLTSALEDGKKACTIADNLIAKCRIDCRELELLRLSAATKVHKARMGLVILECSRVLRYPTPDDEPIRERLVGELRELIDEWSTLREESYRLINPGTFPETSQEVLRVKFEPEGRKFMERCLDILQSGENVRRFLGD